MFGNILVSLLVIYAFCLFVCLWLIKLMWQSIKQAYETVDRAIFNEYWTRSYKQLYEANFSIFKKLIESAFQKWFHNFPSIWGERSLPIDAKVEGQGGSGAWVTEPSCESLSFRQKKAVLLLKFVLHSVCPRTTSIYFHSITYH